MMIFIFFFGLILGSFLNAMLYRYQTKQSPLERSKCPKCGKQINWYDNIPLFSWLLLRGRCRNCNKSISIQYPLVELGAGIITVLVAQKMGAISAFNNFLFNGQNPSPVSFALFTIALSIFLLLFWVSLYDIKTKEIPNGVNLSFIILALAYALISTLPQGGFSNIWPYLVAGVAFFGIFYALVVVSGETWLGGGDAKLALGIGLLLGPWLSFLTLMIASITGSIYGITVLILQKSNNRLKGSKSKPNTLHEIPFGPFLAMATLVSFLYGSQIINWYVNMVIGL